MPDEGQIRTDLYCTECSENFVAELDLRIDGNHVVECPHCGHEHCRVVKNGTVTGDRWDSRAQRVDVAKRLVWKAKGQPIMTSSASRFIRESWLNRLDPQP